MPGKGNKNRGRGRGGFNRGRGGFNRGRGRGRGSGRGGGGGRGRNRNLIPTSLGYVYQLESNVDEFNDDFRIYGQFGSDQEDSEPEMYQPKSKKKSKKSNFQLKKQSRSPLESSYVGHDLEERPSFASGSQQTAANGSGSEAQFAKGKSKYFKRVLFTKSTSVLNSSDETQDIEEGDKLTTPPSESTLNESSATDISRGPKKRNITSTTETIDFADLESTINNSNQKVNHDKVVLKDKGKTTVGSIDQAKTSVNVNQEQVDTKRLTSEEEESEEEPEVEEPEVEESEEEEPEVEESEEESEEEESEEEESEEECFDEELFSLEELMEKIQLNEDGTIQDLLIISDDEDLYDYATLDKETDSEDSSDEEDHMISNYKKSHHINENIRKMKSHRTQDDHATVDPEIFGRSLQTALADVPTGLKPGMRRWYEKQQRRENRKKKKADAKILKKEKKKKNKGKPSASVEDQVFSSQLIKIDERMRGFIMDDSLNSYQFAPMGTYLRRQIHLLAAFYNVKSKSGGHGDSRYTVVTRTNETRIPDDRRSIDRFISGAQLTLNDQSRIINNNRKKYATPKTSTTKNNKSGSSTPRNKSKDINQNIPTPGSIVGYNAAPINEDNVGHRMLAAMGWKQGDALGSKNDGITAPIEAVIRKKNRGLGLI